MFETIGWSEDAVVLLDQRLLPGREEYLRLRTPEEIGEAIRSMAVRGAPATAGYGTALGVIRAAVEAGKQVQVVAGETRPFLQGARLTAWELSKDGIPTVIITDSMAGNLLRSGGVSLVVVGADRVAANGDVANKIGT